MYQIVFEDGTLKMKPMPISETRVSLSVGQAPSGIRRESLKMAPSFEQSKRFASY